MSEVRISHDSQWAGINSHSITLEAFKNLIGYHNSCLTFFDVASRLHSQRPYTYIIYPDVKGDIYLSYVKENGVVSEEHELRYNTVSQLFSNGHPGSFPSVAELAVAIMGCGANEAKALQESV